MQQAHVVAIAVAAQLVGHHHSDRHLTATAVHAQSQRRTTAAAAAAALATNLSQRGRDGAA